MTGYFNHDNAVDNPSVVGRFASLLTNAVHRKSVGGTGSLLPLPKLVIIVPDNNLVNAVGENITQNVSKAYSRLLNYIMTEYDRCVAAFKENLPACCIKSPGYPSFLWIQPPRHKNFKDNSQRYKFNRCLEDVVDLHPNMFTLALKKGWDSEDTTLFVDRFTSSGLKSYWEAVDKTIRYFDSVVLKKNDKKQKKFKGQETSQKDKFR